MKGRPAYRKTLIPVHAYAPDDAECCTWRGDDGRICGLPQFNRHHNTGFANHESLAEPAQPPTEDRQLRMDIDG